MPASWRKAVEVPRYFLHLRFQEAVRTAWPSMRRATRCPTRAPLQAHVEVTARDLMRHTRLAAIPDWHTCTFEVTDEAGQLVLTLPFSNLRGKGT